MVSYVCFFFYLYFHACIARPLMVGVGDNGDLTQLQIPSEEVSVILRNNLKAGYGEHTPDMIIGGNDRTWGTPSMPHQATATEIWRRTERSTLESAASKAEENVNFKNRDPVEDVVAMDYAQPHRKPPIHNKGT